MAQNRLYLVDREGARIKHFARQSFAGDCKWELAPGIEQWLNHSPFAKFELLEEHEAVGFRFQENEG